MGGQGDDLVERILPPVQMTGSKWSSLEYLVLGVCSMLVVLSISGLAASESMSQVSMTAQRRALPGDAGGARLRSFLLIV